MNETYLHLTLTHLPIVGSLISLLLLISGFLQKDGSITKAALYLLVFLALATILVNYTGEEAEEFVEHLPGFSHDAIHEHEEIAEWAFRLMNVTGICALAGLFMLKRRSAKSRIVVLVTLLANLVAFGFMVYAGKKGGEIRHTEIQAKSEQNVE